MEVSGPGSNKQITTYTFLDNGSDATLCLRGLLEELDHESEPTDFTLTTVRKRKRKRTWSSSQLEDRSPR